MQCLAWLDHNNSTMFWAANTFPNQRYCSYSRDILKLLQRNFCGPAHKSDFSCEQKILEDWLAKWRTVQCCAAPDKLLWKHMFFHFYLKHVWFEVSHPWFLCLEIARCAYESKKILPSNCFKYFIYLKVISARVESCNMWFMKMQAK